MAHVFLHHVVGDLTLGKPELVQFYDSEPVEAAVRAIGDSAEGAITVWRSPSPDSAAVPRPPPSADRFVGMLNSLDVVLFLARARVHDQEKSMRTPVSELITPNHDLLKEVDPATRLIDALDMMKQGVRRLLVRKSVMWRGFSKRFSVLYNGKWLKNSQSSSVGGASNSDRPSSSVLHENKYCCLSREDIVRFLIGCLGALAPLPLSSISSLGAINSNYSFIEAFSPTLEAIQKIPHNPCAIAVVETNSDGTHKIIGDISAYKLWKCDYWAAAWAMRNLSAGQFVLGADDYGTALDSVPDFSIDSPPENTVAGASLRRQKFSSRSMGFSSSQVNQMPLGRLRNMYRGRSAPLTCKPTSSLAAVMAQMLSYRATHVWVIDAAIEDDTVVGIVTFTEILIAVTHYPAS
ncbi:CBS domain-containing protein CBSX6-like [Zingiber officinale]|uniref:CBS domain-containing protein CBSX6-like n=1 Tax=Zingiber officinale TaxID=94328 RepID=UPI001C4B5206|nr:CBS domain-containing protein CBSX6-like [Zingiber officinale]